MPDTSAPRSRLLERLLQRETGSVDEQVASALQSIQQHLELLLNSRPDSCRCAPTLGLVDFNATALGCADLHTRLAEEIRQCITHYEPRLQQVRVSSTERPEQAQNPLVLQFQIEGQIRFAEQARHASFTLQLDSNRRYRMVN
jgi:type VI secretion system protein